MKQVSDKQMTIEEARARWICCPLCDKKKCEINADDCDVNIHLKNKVESGGTKNDKIRMENNQRSRDERDATEADPPGKEKEERKR